MSRGHVTIILWGAKGRARRCGGRGDGEGGSRRLFVRCVKGDKGVVVDRGEAKRKHSLGRGKACGFNGIRKVVEVEEFRDVAVSTEGDTGDFTDAWTRIVEVGGFFRAVFIHESEVSRGSEMGIEAKEVSPRFGFCME